MFSKIEIVPRWIIFAIDICLSAVTLLLAEVIAKNFIVTAINFHALYRAALVVIIINVFVFYFLKTYAGIVRYTSAQDSVKILGAVLLSAFLIFVVNAFVVTLEGSMLISFTTLVNFTMFSFLILTAYRMSAKAIFLYFKTAKLDRRRIIIYGAGEAGLVTKRTFDHDPTTNKKIIAFVDDDERKIGKTVNGIIIKPATALDDIINKKQVDEIIFASYSIPAARKNQIVDLCLQHRVRVLNIPSPDVWTKPNLSPKLIHKINIEDLLDRKAIKMDMQGIGAELKGKRVLVSGAAGSIGSEIVRQLMKFETALIIMLDQSETALHNLSLEMEEHRSGQNVHAFIGDVKDAGRMEFLFSEFKPQYVYHAAAYKHVPLMEDNPAESVKTNVLGTKTMADLSVKHRVEKFVMISTDKAVNPTNIMGACKRIAEIYVQSLNNTPLASGTRFITTRFGNVLGSNGSVIPRFKQQIERGGPITVTHPEITRYFMTIPEACQLVLEAGFMGKGGEIFIFDMGKSVKIVDLAKRMIQLAGMEPNRDIQISYSGLRPGEKLYEELLNDSENTLPTHHEKIMIGQVRQYVFTEVETQVLSLIAEAIINDNNKVVLQMKKLVPEFKSKNSKFEELDNLLEQERKANDQGDAQDDPKSA
jgi:FlaA1/EpsC-like NDP-sugar epimerase